MRRIAALLALLGASTAAVAHAQVRVGVRVGAMASTPLVRDSIVEAFSVRPAIAPQLAFSMETALTSAWQLAGSVSLAWSRLSRRAAGGSEAMVPLTVWTPTLALGRRVAGFVIVSGTIGAAIYDPDHGDGNLFANGSPILPLVGLGFAVERELQSTIRYTLHLDYDLHRFTTNTLRDSGFGGQQAVHRVALGVSLTRVIRD